MTDPAGAQPPYPPQEPAPHPPHPGQPASDPTGDSPLPPAAPPSPGSSTAPEPAPAETTEGEPTPAGLTKTGKVRTTRVSAWWTGLIIAAVLLILLLIFIAQNSRDVTVHYLGLHGQVSLAIALLLSAVAGILLVAIPGTARILQLRHALKHNAGVRSSRRRKA